MDYEQKYKDALERAKDMLSYKEVRKEDMEYLFPELAESEDEKIKEEIIAVFKGKIPYTSEEDAKRYIAWLEKQGEQNFDYEHADIPQKDFAPIEPKTLDADKVIAWLNENVADFWESPCNPQNIINQFKKNFEL